MKNKENSLLVKIDPSSVFYEVDIKKVNLKPKDKPVGYAKKPVYKLTWEFVDSSFILITKGSLMRLNEKIAKIINE